MTTSKKNIFNIESLTGLFSKDWLLKFISLLLAVVLWYFVGGEDRIDKNVMIPIEIINLPRDLVISNQFKKEIEVTVSGPRSVILDMTNRAVTRQVDLSKATPGTMVIDNDNDHIPVPRGVTVQRVQPASIILSLDKLIQKEFPVIARYIGEVGDGYELRSLTTDPDVITITGPRTTLLQFDDLYTRTIDLSGLKESVQIQVPLELEPAIVELIGETSITADIEIAVETVVKTLENMKIDPVVDGVVRVIEPERVTVVARIPRLLLDKKVDLKSLLTLSLVRMEDKNGLRVKAVARPEVELPIEIISIIPSTVRLTDLGEQLRVNKETVEKPAAVGNIEVPENGVKDLTTDKTEEDGEPAGTDTTIPTIKRIKEKHLLDE